MQVESGNIRQFLVAPEDAMTFPITRCNGKPTIVWDVGALRSLRVHVALAKLILEDREPTR